MESPGGGGRPVSPPIAGLPGGMPRQRGFYSEPLDAGMPAEELEAIASESAAGPRTAKLQPSTARQAVPKASLFRGRGTEARADVGRRAHAALEAANEVRAIFPAARSTHCTTPAPLARRQPRSRAPPPPPQANVPQRALEPKVLVPFAPGAGRTPRRIVIERQKRLFALQDVGALLLDLGVDGRRWALDRLIVVLPLRGRERQRRWDQRWARAAATALEWRLHHSFTKEIGCAALDLSLIHISEPTRPY